MHMPYPAAKDRYKRNSDALKAKSKELACE